MFYLISIKCVVGNSTFKYYTNFAITSPIKKKTNIAQRPQSQQFFRIKKCQQRRYFAEPSIGIENDLYFFDRITYSPRRQRWKIPIR